MFVQHQLQVTQTIRLGQQRREACIDIALPVALGSLSCHGVGAQQHTRQREARPENRLQSGVHGPVHAMMGLT